MGLKTAFLTGIFLMLLMAEEATMNTGVYHEYHFIKTKMSWSDAQSYCRENFDDLASVTTKEEQKLLDGVFEPEGLTWFGLRKIETARFVWSDGTGINVFEWNPSSGGCTLMRKSGVWESQPCNKMRASVCYKYGSNGAVTYIFNDQLLSWRDALSYCRQNYIDLVTVLTTEQNSHIRSVANGEKVWIGLFKDDWAWSDGNPNSFRNWDLDEPDSSALSCGVLRPNLAWAEKDCSKKLPFICHSVLKGSEMVVMVKLNSGVDLNQPSLSDSLLKQFQTKLEETGLSGIKISWRVRKDGKVLQREQDKN